MYHDAGSQADQTRNGGQWNRLGTWSFTAGNGYSVEIRDNANGYVIADAIRIVPVDAGPNTATWTFDLPAAGDYQVYAKWTAHPNRATNAADTIHTADHPATVLVDQSQNGGGWHLLGSYSFQAGSGHKIELTDRADGHVIADAVYLIPAGDPSSNRATWKPALTIPNHYDVYARWTAHPNRATNATYTVHHRNGSAAVSVNQQTRGGAWNLLGNFELDGQSTITLTDQADGYVIADAIRIVRTGTAPSRNADELYDVHTDHLATPKAITDPDHLIVGLNN